MLAKPTWADFILNPENAELKTDLEIRGGISIIWNTNDVFAQQLELSLLEKNMNTISTLCNETILEEGALPILSKTILIKKYMDMTDEDLNDHATQIKKDIETNIETEKELGIWVDPALEPEF